MKQTERQQDQSPPESVDHRGSNSVKSIFLPSLSKRSSVRNSLSQKTIQRSESLDSGYHEANSFVEDSINSWDASAVELDVRQAVLGKSSPTPRFLEIIPATLTSSRSLSPGIPLNLEPASGNWPKSCSYNPANSYRNATKKNSRVTSSNRSLREAQMHPFFRLNSPKPFSAATRRTVVTAALSAGQAISDRQSISRLQLSQHLTMEKEDCKGTEEEIEEGKMTPPTPDWI
ncbi:hypothetical protein B7463_g8020, partial [Scytalidium lignicola]